MSKTSYSKEKFENYRKIIFNSNKMKSLLNAPKASQIILRGFLKMQEPSKKHKKNKLSLVIEAGGPKTSFIVKQRRGKTSY